MVTCENCDGNREVEVFWSFTPPDNPEVYPCPECCGTGEVDGQVDSFNINQLTFGE